MTGHLEAAVPYLLVTATVLGSCGGSGRDCPSHFDTRGWRDATFDSDRKLELALQVERCGYVKSAARAKVRSLLGAPDTPKERYLSDFRREWDYVIGEVFGEYGPADEQSLTISFGRRGRVKDAYVSPKAED